MINDKNIIILKGDTEKAKYKVQDVEEYVENPFIEALPNIFSENDVLDRFTRIPVLSDEDKTKPPNVRYHLVKRVKNFVQPLPIHFIIERRLSMLIRRGYLARNPLDKTYLERIQILNDIKDEGASEFQINEKLRHIRSTADSILIIGISGIGKTTAIERLLLMYPQIIKHDEYRGHLFSRTQIVWLKIDCPYDGSLTTLCKSFFKAIDDILGTRYLEKFGYTNRITSTMMLHMTSLASIYGIGALVIDEIQHLVNSKNNIDEMLNFFVTLSNTVGIPTVLIGTSRAQKILRGNFRQARRAASEGSIMWDRMDKESDEWNFFLESLWDFQYLNQNHNITLTDKIKDVFYDECQGITAVAVSLFILAQERAIAKEQEEITVTILRDTGKEDLQHIQPMIRALRKNSISEMMKYDDILLNLEDIVTNYRSEIDLNGRIKDLFKDRKKTLALTRKDIEENLIYELKVMDLFQHLSNDDIKKICKKTVEHADINDEFAKIKLIALKNAMKLNESYGSKSSKKAESLNKSELLYVYEYARKNKKHTYEVLKKQGYIKNPVDEFLKVE